MADKPDYDAPRYRKAKSLKSAIKKPNGHRLSHRDFKEIKRQAEALSDREGEFKDAKIMSYHKRRKRSRWAVGKDKIYEVFLKAGLLSIMFITLIPGDVS